MADIQAGSRIGDLPGSRNTATSSRRKLRRHAAFWSLWALGGGAAISGDFYGWNLGLDAGGFGGSADSEAASSRSCTTACATASPRCSPALPPTGGAPTRSLLRWAMGPWGGFVTGLAENMEYVITAPAVVVSAMGFLIPRHRCGPRV